MKPYLNKVLFHVVNIQVPSSIDEFNQLGGDALAEAIKQIIYGSWNTKFRKLLCETLEGTTGISRNTKKNDEGKDVYTESESEYVKRVLGSGKLNDESAQQIWNDVASEVDIADCIRPTVRTKKAPKEVVATASGVIQSVKDGDSTKEEKMALFEKALDLDSGTFEARFGDFDQESVEQALLAVHEKRAREAASEFV